MVFVYAMHAAFGRGAAQAITSGNQTSVLQFSQQHDMAIQSACAVWTHTLEPLVSVLGWRWDNTKSGTYCLFASFPPGGVEWVMVLCNMQMQDVLVREVSLAFRTPVHVRFTVVHVILVDGGKSKRLMRGEQALHDGWLLTHSRLGVEVDELDIGQCLA